MGKLTYLSNKLETPSDVLKMIPNLSMVPVYNDCGVHEVLTANSFVITLPTDEMPDLIKGDRILIAPFQEFGKDIKPGTKILCWATRKDGKSMPCLVEATEPPGNFQIALPHPAGVTSLEPLGVCTARLTRYM